MNTLLNVFVYPVSGIMKLWHWIFHDLAGLTDSTSWLVSIIFLIVTVRSLIAPLTWMSVKAGRIGAIIRPRLQQLKNEYEEATTVEEIRTFQDKRRETHAEFNYRPALGCLPPLLMLPVFIGLYRVLLLMSRPLDNGADAAAGSSAAHAIGLLTAEEVESFRHVEFFGVPLPAYASMSPQLEQEFGISTEDVVTAMMPVLIVAISFTVINLTITAYRSYWTTEWSSAFGRRLFKFTLILIVLVPGLLLWLAFNFPIPWAIIMYWFVNNLWTMVQSIVFYWLIVRRYPLQEEHHTARRQSHDTFRKNKRERKEIKAQTRKENRLARKDPQEAERIAAKRRQAAQEEENKRQRRKEIKAQQAKARAELMRLKRSERESQRSQSTDDATDSGDSNGDSDKSPRIEGPETENKDSSGSQTPETEPSRDERTRNEPDGTDETDGDETNNDDKN